MEPERKIEKLLRAYAKKRRGEAGDAFKLHPATRRLLQGEAARRKPPAEVADDSVSLWELFRERWPVLLGFTLILFFGAALLMPALSKAKLKSQQVLAMSQTGERELKSAGKPAAPPSEPVSGLAGADLKPAAAAPQAPVAFRGEVAAQSQIADNRPAPTVMPPPASLPVEADTMTVNGLAEPRAAVKAKPAAAAVTDGVAMSERPAVNAGYAAAARSTDFKTILSAGSVLANAENRSQRFVQSAQAAKPTPVLASFELRQNGNDIAVVDRDGSVYNGALDSGEVKLAKKSADKLKDETAAAQNFSFRVTGLNRTLNQNVVFTGNVAGVPGQTTDFAPTQNSSNQLVIGGSLQSMANQSQGSLFFNSILTGTVTIDRTNTIEINALPVSP